MAWKPKDIRELMLQDQARGKRRVRPVPDKVQERRTLCLDMKVLLEIKDEVTFLRVLITDYELQVDSEQYRRAVKIWKDYQRDRGFFS